MNSLAQRQFNWDDQERFASFSGDRNPMHMDALLARRTQAGAPVVHGIHLLLWALDAFAASVPKPGSLRRCRAQFSKFVYVGDSVEVMVTQRTLAGARLSVVVDGAQRAKIALEFGEPIPFEAAWHTDALEIAALSGEPLTLTLEQANGRSGRIPLQLASPDAAAMFPAAAQWLGAGRVAAVAATTYLVGMVCPGLHSIYSELDFSCCPESEGEGALAFRVVETDPRFHSVEQEVMGGGICGTVKGFFRTPPVAQAAMGSLTGRVTPDEFAGSVALVVGGSRGLGELTAKLIAAGGGRVVITWQSGKADAERVAEEIRAAGGHCDTLAYDARKPAGGQLASIEAAPTHAYYFATPTIFRPQAEIYSATRLDEFLAVYVEGFWQLAQALRASWAKVSLFYPSTVFVVDRPKGMTEYSMAKAAGEVLCADMNNALAPLHVTVSRLPRLSTDQTASVTAAETADPIDCILPIIREVQSWPH